MDPVLRRKFLCSWGNEFLLSHTPRRGDLLSSTPCLRPSHTLLDLFTFEFMHSPTDCLGSVEVNLSLDGGVALDKNQC